MTIKATQTFEVIMLLREKGEPLGDFIGRFVKSKREKKQFTDIKQRLAIGYSEAREEDAKRKKGKHHGK